MLFIVGTILFVQHGFSEKTLILHMVCLFVLTALLVMVPRWGNQMQQILQTSILDGLGVDPSDVHDQYNQLLAVTRDTGSDRSWYTDHYGNADSPPNADGNWPCSPCTEALRSNPIVRPTRPAASVPHFINSTTFAARDFWPRRGASDAHTLLRSVRSEQRRLGQKEPPPGGVASLFGSGFVAPRSQPHFGGFSLVAPRQNRKSTQQTWSYL